MPFITKLDFGNDRQARQEEKTLQHLYGGTSFGVTFSALTTGPDLTKTGITSNIASISSDFTGTTGSTIYSWYDARMVLGEQGLSAITPSNSGLTQNTGPYFEPSSFIVVDGNTIAIEYTGLSFDVVVNQMIDLGGGNFSGNAITNVVWFYSAASIDFTGRTIWVDVSGKTRTEELIITKNPTIGYVLTCIDAEGGGAWMAGGSGGSSVLVTGGTYNNATGTATYTNSTGGTFQVTGFTTGSTSGCCFDVFVTGGTYSNGTLSLINNSGNTFSITGFSTGNTFTDVYVTGATYSAGTAIFRNNTGGTFSVSGFSTGNTSGFDVFVTGGTYSNITGIATYTNNTGGTFSVTGFNTGSTSGCCFDVFVTGGTYSNITGIATFTNNTGGTFSVTGFNIGTGGTSGSTTSVWTAGTGVNTAVLSGSNSTASNNNSVAEGYSSIASGIASHSFGLQTLASGDYSIAEGFITVAIGLQSHAEGQVTTALGDNSHAEGSQTTAFGVSSHAEGNGTKATGISSHSEGQSTFASGDSSHAEGTFTTASGDSSHSEGKYTYAIGAYTHSEGDNTSALGESSHTEGSGTTASGNYSHTEGYGNTSSGNASHAEGGYLGTSGPGATLAIGDSSHSEGWLTTASGQGSHAEGVSTTASGSQSHAEGSTTQALGDNSHAEGTATKALGINSHAGGQGYDSFTTVAANDIAAFNHSIVTSYLAGIIGAGANGVGSAILGGIDHKIFSTSDYSSIIGGYRNVVSAGITGSTILGGNNLSALSADTTYVPRLNINVVGTTPGINTLRIDASGNLTTTVSDKRLKENINGITNSLDIIKKLNGVSYQWKDRIAGGNDVSLGFIAQEVGLIDSRLVFTNKVDGYMGIHIDSIIPLLVEAVKELASGVTTSNNTHLETQTILAEDNNIELNYNGNQQTALGGGITVLHAKGKNLSSELITDENGNWITNNDFKSKYLTIPLYTPSSTLDTFGTEGNITRDDNYLYVKTANGWKRNNLESF